MKFPNEFNTIDTATMDAAIKRGRVVRAKAFHAMWKAALRSFR